MELDSLPGLHSADFDFDDFYLGKLAHELGLDDPAAVNWRPAANDNGEVRPTSGHADNFTGSKAKPSKA